LQGGDITGSAYQYDTRNKCGKNPKNVYFKIFEKNKYRYNSTSYEKTEKYF
jgi:hypothetical protein